MKSTVVNIRSEECEVYIGRKKGEPNHFGNPFQIGKDGSRQEVIRKFREWINGIAYQNVEPERRQWILQNLHLLEGKKLGCYCKPQSCHGDVYVEILDRMKQKL